MTHRSDCTIKPEARRFVDDLADCYVDGDQHLDDPWKRAFLLRAPRDEAEAIIEDGGGRVVDSYAAEDATVVVAHDMPTPDSGSYFDIPELQDIAKRGSGKWNDQHAPEHIEKLCNAMARDRGLEWVGVGAARSTLLVTPDPEDPGDMGSQITPFSTCVLKVARNGTGINSGTEQNREEVTNYESLPQKLRGDVDHKGPIFNPISEHESNYRWVTQPYCPPPGNAGEVLNRLHKHGYDIEDIAGRGKDNVGTYPDHGGNAIIDYGFTLKKRSVDLSGELSQITDALRDQPVTDIESSSDTVGGDVEFFASGLPGHEIPSQDSTIQVTGAGLVDYIEVFLPGWDERQFSKTELRRELSTALGNASPIVARYETWIGGGSVLDPSVEVQITHGDPIPVDVAVSVVEDIIEDYMGHFKQYADDPQSTTTPTDFSGDLSRIEHAEDFEDVEGQWRAALDNAGMRNIAFPGRNEPDAVFNAPLDNVPHPSVTQSELWWFNEANVKRVRYYAAEVAAGRNTRAKVRTNTQNVARKVHDKYSGTSARVKGQIRHKDTDPHGSGDLYDVVYEIVYVGDHMDPQLTVDIIESVTKKHNRTFARHIIDNY